MSLEMQIFLPSTLKNFIGSTCFTVIGNFGGPKCLIQHSFILQILYFCEAIMISIAEASQGHMARAVPQLPWFKASAHPVYVDSLEGPGLH